MQTLVGVEITVWDFFKMCTELITIPAFTAPRIMQG